MKEPLVSLETAKLLKEKGCNVGCNYFYNIETGKLELSTADNYVGYNERLYVGACTQSLAQKWLREKHNIDITVSLVADAYGFYIHKDRNYTNRGESYDFLGSSYEKALEQAILESLKLIK